MKRERITVAPNKGEWTVTVGSQVFRFLAQWVAIEQGAFLGRQIAAKGGKAELVIKGKNGRIRDSRSYGKDPRKSKG